ncbi:hypothetical protein BC830DRAFT_520780 [Chytriomyces sp. MP71]|nr:hypothetical protein BC830DRAFT_520780 [Chytriomyces sp. MP71]
MNDPITFHQKMMESYLARSVKASSWDESIPMSLASTTTSHVQGPPFNKLVGVNSLTLFEYNETDATEATLEAALTSLLAESNSFKSIIIKVETFGAIIPSPELMASLGFKLKLAKKCMRVKDLVSLPANAQPPTRDLGNGLTIVPVDPSSPLWEGRIQLEKTLFYGFDKDGSYLARLRVALKHMVDVGGDIHYVVVAGEDMEVVGYMTMRYRWGVAYLQGAGVLEAYRKKGITRKMLEVSEWDCRTKGFDCIVTTGCDENAEKAWAAMGFTRLLSPSRVYEKIKEPIEA